MRRTNLIPQALLSKQSRFTFKTPNEYYLFIAAVVLFSIFIALEVFYLAGIGIFAAQAKISSNKLASLTKSLSENANIKEAIEAQIKAWRQKREQAEERVAFLKNEVGQDILWSGALEKLNSLLPAQLWLVRLSLSENAVAIKGNTYDNLLISTFISSLSNSNYFSDIMLVYAQKNKVKADTEGAAEREVVEFEVSCRLIGASAPKEDIPNPKEK